MVWWKRGHCNRITHWLTIANLYIVHQICNASHSILHNAISITLSLGLGVKVRFTISKQNWRGSRKKNYIHILYCTYMKKDYIVLFLYSRYNSIGNFTVVHRLSKNCNMSQRIRNPVEYNRLDREKEPVNEWKWRRAREKDNGQQQWLNQTEPKKKLNRSIYFIGLIVIYWVNQSNLLLLLNVPPFQLYEFRHTRTYI